MATRVRRILDRPGTSESPRQPAGFTDDLLRDIFLRLASPVDLVRASAACVSFRRVIADPDFLRRYRSIHPPLFLGFLVQGKDQDRRFYPTGAPDRNAPARRALARAASFTFDFIPRSRGRPWSTCDVRDGRVLLESITTSTFFPDLAVCDPLSCQYVLLPAIPLGLVTSVQFQVHKLECFAAYLVPSRDPEDTQFKVVAKTYYREEKFVAFIFSSDSGGWSVGALITCDALSLPLHPIGYIMRFPHHYAYGCFYWKLFFKNKLIKLDLHNMEFSSLTLPPDHEMKLITIVEVGEGLLGMISRSNGYSDTFLYYTISQNGGERSNEWKMEKTIPMPMGFTCYCVGASDGYILLLGYPKGSMVSKQCFSLELNTFKIEVVSQIMVRKGHTFFPYFRFPLSISLRRI